MRMLRLSPLVLLVITASALAACGGGEPASSAQDLASWRDRVCALTASLDRAMESDIASEDDPSPSLPREMTRLGDVMRDVAAKLRALPPPTERRADAEKFVEMFVTMAARYAESEPRIDAAVRRWERVVETIDPESLPPFPEGQTVAGGIMTQLLSVPAARDAWNDLMREFEALAAADDKKEAIRLEKSLGLDRCKKKRGEERLSAGELRRCGSRGSPVTIAKLVEVFRANGITLDIDEETCRSSAQERAAAALPDATNAGPSGLDEAYEVWEGHVLCDAGSADFGRKIEVIKYKGESETFLRVLNVHCTVYPYDAASEAMQVEQVRRALEALVRETRSGDNR